MVLKTFLRSGCEPAWNDGAEDLYIESTTSELSLKDCQRRRDSSPPSHSCYFSFCGGLSFNSGGLCWRIGPVLVKISVWWPCLRRGRSANKRCQQFWACNLPVLPIVALFWGIGPSQASQKRAGRLGENVEVRSRAGDDLAASSCSCNFCHSFLAFFGNLEFCFCEIRRCFTATQLLVFAT